MEFIKSIQQKLSTPAAAEPGAEANASGDIPGLAIPTASTLAETTLDEPVYLTIVWLSPFLFCSKYSLFVLQIVIVERHQDDWYKIVLRVFATRKGSKSAQRL